MKVERTHEFDVPAATLVDVLTSRRFYECRHQMSGIDDYRFDAFDETERGFLIRILRDIEINGSNIPSFARRFLGRSYTLTQEFLWTHRDQPPYRARYRFALGNLPVEVNGDVTITQVDGRARQRYVVLVTSNMPLIGAKLAGLVGERVDKALDSDYRGTQRYLQHEGLIPG